MKNYKTFREKNLWDLGLGERSTDKTPKEEFITEKNY